MVQILLATLSDLTRPGPATLMVGLTPAHPHHLLVLRVLLLLINVVHNEPPLQGGVPSGPRTDEGLQEVTGRAGSFLEMSLKLLSLLPPPSSLSPGAVWPGGECDGGGGGGEAGPESSAAAETTGGEFCSTPAHYQ